MIMKLVSYDGIVELQMVPHTLLLRGSIILSLGVVKSQ
jgi:hypothetical protein